MNIARAEYADPQDADSERRRGLRIRQCRPVKVFDPVSARYLGGQTRDVSASGLQLELPYSSPLQPGRLVHVHIGVSNGPEGLTQRRGMIPARIIWVDRRLDQQSLSAGVELVTAVASVGAA